MSKKGNPPIGIGRIDISAVGGRGWTESYNLKGGTYSACHANFAPIINFRNLLLGGGCHVERWTISDSNVSHDGYQSMEGVDLSTTYILSTDTLVSEDVNNIEDAVKVRFVTGTGSPAVLTGKGLTYKFRGVRDSFIPTKQKVLSSLVGVTANTYTPSALGTGLTPVQAWKSFLYWIMAGCVMVKNVPGSPDATNNLYNLVQAYTKPFTGTRDTGRDPTASKGRIRRQFV